MESQLNDFLHLCIGFINVHIVCCTLDFIDSTSSGVIYRLTVSPGQRQIGQSAFNDKSIR